MRKNKIRRLMAAALTAAMVVSMGGMSALASTEGTADVLVDNTEIKEFTISKSITKGDNVYTPDVDISFTVTHANGGTNGLDSDGSNDKTVYTGLEGGITFTSSAAFDVETGSPSNASKNAKFQINKNVFKTNGQLNPGIYRYNFSEVDPTYDGLTPSDDTFIIDLYVSEENGVSSFVPIVYKNDVNVNNKISNIVNRYDTNTLTVVKKVEGNQGDKTVDFKFDITIKGAPGEKYYVVEDGVADRSAVCNENGIATIEAYLKNDEDIVIYGLSQNDEFTVEEEADGQNGYTTTYKLNGSGVSKDELLASQKMNGENKTVEVTNSKSVNAPTGIALSFAPYALLVVLAGVFGVLFLRKRRDDEI